MGGRLRVEGLGCRVALLEFGQVQERNPHAFTLRMLSLEHKFFRIQPEC